MEVLVVKPFKDRKEGVTRNQGDTFTLSKERYKEINSTKFGVLVEAVAEGTKPTKSTKKKGGAKK